MQYTATRLWNKNFTLLMIVLVLSSFVNQILTFALPLYVLDISGSPALFGIVLALSTLPMVIMSPLGGVIADRGKKQKIMFWCDLLTALVVLGYLTSYSFPAAFIPTIIFKLVVLSVFHGLYVPAIMSGPRLLAPPDKVANASAISNTAFSLAAAIGPVIGGILYGRIGIMWILIGASVLFLIAAILDMFIRIPAAKADKTEKIREVAKRDLGICLKFAFFDKPIIGKLLMIVFLVSITTDAMIMMGLPVLVTQTLGLRMDFVGSAQSLMLIGGLMGGFLTGALKKRVTIKSAHWIILLAAVSIGCAGLALMSSMPRMAAFAIVALSSAMVMLTIQIVTIQILAYIQVETPAELIGKVTAISLGVTMAAYPVGKFVFGLLFEWFARGTWLVMFIAAGVTAAVAISSNRIFRYAPHASAGGRGMIIQNFSALRLKSSWSGSGMTQPLDVSEVDIRPATPRDIKELSLLYYEFYGYKAGQYPEYYRTPEESKRHILKMISAKNSDILVATERGVIYGFLLVVESETSSDKAHVPHKYAEVVDFITVEAFRKMGIGSKLMEAAKAWAAARHLDYIEMTVLAGATDENMFYRHKDFKTIARIMRSPL